MRIFIYEDYRCVFTLYDITVYKYNANSDAYIFDRKIRSSVRLTREKLAIKELLKNDGEYYETV